MLCLMLVVSRIIVWFLIIIVFYSAATHIIISFDSIKTVTKTMIIFTTFTFPVSIPIWFILIVKIVFRIGIFTTRMRLLSITELVIIFIIGWFIMKIIICYNFAR